MHAGRKSFLRGALDPLSTAAAAAGVAAFSFGVVDVLLAVLDRGLFLKIFAAHVLASTAIFPAVLLVVFVIGVDPDRPKMVVLHLLAAGLAGAAFAWITKESLAGSVIMGRSPFLARGARFVTTFSATVGTYILLGRATRARSSPLGGRLAGAAILLFAAAIAAASDRTLLRGQYDGLHTAAAVAAHLLLATAVAILFGGRSGTSGPLLRIGALAYMAAAALSYGLFLDPHTTPSLSRASTASGSGLRRALEIGGALLPDANDDAGPDFAAADRILAPAEFDRPAFEASRASLRKALLRPDIVIFSIDTVRADRVGFLGYAARPTTPNWDRIAAESVVFERAYTACPTSDNSFSAMFASTWAEESPQNRAEDRAHAQQPLAGLLRAVGYETRAYTSFETAHTGPTGFFSTFPRGFDVFEHDPISGGECDGRLTIERALAHLEGRDRSRPLFLWIHLMDPHAPYVRHAESDFGTTPSDRYDSEIAYADRALGDFLAALAKTGGLERTLLFVHSDHGESLGDRGYDYHNSNLHDEQTRVPATLRIPGLQHRTIREPTSLIDLVPTLLSIIGIADPLTAKRRGRDLLPTILGFAEDDGEHSAAFSQLLLAIRTGRKSSIVHKRLKFVSSPDSYPKTKFFDLERDPLELDNLTGRNDPRERVLDALVRRIRSQIAEKP